MNNNNNSIAGIYIHIPFCTVKCLYCDFYSITDQENNIPTFVNSLISEIKLWGEKNNVKLISSYDCHYDYLIVFWTSALLLFFCKIIIFSYCHFLAPKIQLCSR